VNREADLVELVDEHGDAAGSCSVAEAHDAPGRLHRAFSVLLRDPDGRLLLQRRARVKTRFPLRWANSCCGHPPPGGDLLAAAGRRLGEELGVSGVRLRALGVFAYRAEDPVTGRVEREYDHVLLGDVPADLPLDPDPAEVAEVSWVAADRLRDALAGEPDAYAPWLAGVLGVYRAEAERAGEH
jgi:isopentenyl-diphosphate delta-isomerase